MTVNIVDVVLSFERALKVSDDNAHVPKPKSLSKHKDYVHDYENSTFLSFMIEDRRSPCSPPFFAGLVKKKSLLAHAPQTAFSGLGRQGFGEHGPLQGLQPDPLTQARKMVGGAISTNLPRVSNLTETDHPPTKQLSLSITNHFYKNIPDPVIQTCSLNEIQKCTCDSLHYDGVEEVNRANLWVTTHVT